MRKTLGALALVTIALLGMGCKKASPLVGKWTTKTQIGDLNVEFKPDETFALAIKIASHEVDFTGSYKLEGDTLTLTPKDLNVPGMSATELAKGKSAMGSQLNKPQPMKVKFGSDDELSLTSADSKVTLLGKSATLTRVKEGS